MIRRLHKEPRDPGGTVRLSGVRGPSGFGGEEFVVLLPDTRAPGAAAAAERFRRRLAATPFKPPRAEGPVTVTVSIGVAEYRKKHTLDDLVRFADLAMYAAKNGGRNQVARYDRLLPDSSAKTEAG
jgi:diguanylate cyclase (GGDEF)-like protein